MTSTWWWTRVHPPRSSKPSRTSINLVFSSFLSSLFHFLRLHFRSQTSTLLSGFFSFPIKEFFCIWVCDILLSKSPDFIVSLLCFVGIVTCEKKPHDRIGFHGEISPISESITKGKHYYSNYCCYRVLQFSFWSPLFVSATLLIWVFF